MNTKNIAKILKILAVVSCAIVAVFMIVSDKYPDPVPHWFMFTAFALLGISEFITKKWMAGIVHIVIGILWIWIYVISKI